MSSKNPHEITPRFKAFIISILERGKLSKTTITTLTDEESMVVFRKAFTHAGYDAEFNYEFLEFRGDVVVNRAIVEYIRTRFPKVVSVKWLTKLKHNLASKTILAQIAMRGDFQTQINYGRDISDLIRAGRYHENVEYLSMMEDTFEAMAGAVVQVVDDKYRHGVGYAVAYSIIASFFDELPISLKWEDVFDAKSRLKELYDQYKWVIEQSISTRPVKGRTNQLFSVITGYPRGDRTRKPENKEVIGKGVGATSQLAQEAAAEKALVTLKRKYRIEENIPDPYAEVDPSGPEEAPVPPPKIPAGFKEFIRDMLKRARVEKDVIDIFADEDALFEFRMSLVNKTYDPYINQELFKLSGVTIVDLGVAEYLGMRFPRIVSEKWLTNIKHNIVSQGAFAEFAKVSGLEKFVLYGDEMRENIERHPDLTRNTEYLKMLESSFKAFMGALVYVVDSRRRRGVGYATSFNLLASFLNTLPISIDYTNVFDHKSRLKELFDKYRWHLDRSISVDYDMDRSVHVATIVGYPKGNKRRDPRNEVVLGTGEGRTKKEAEQDAAEKAIRLLDRPYNIREIPPDPYQLC